MNVKKIENLIKNWFIYEEKFYPSHFNWNVQEMPTSTDPLSSSLYIQEMPI